MKNLSVPIIIIFLFFANAVNGQSINKKKIDSILANLSKNNIPGVAVGIVQKEKLVYASGFGLADLNTKRKNTSATCFNICSVSKQFTAACIYLLEEQGKLKTSNHLSKYFKDLPAYADTITIDQLIHHQSGIKDFTTLLWLRDMEENGKTTDQQAYATLSRQSSLNFPAGDQESYTNSGYFFLSKIVSIVSGQDLSQFAKAHIFNPLKMANTGFSRSHLVQNKANGYLLEDNKYIQYNPKTSIIGHSNVYSAITDWDKWFNEMKNHRVLGDKVWKKILTPAINNDGNQIDYAGGVRITSFQDQKMISHGGDLPSYHSYMAFFPEKDLGIIIMSNNGTFSGYNILTSIYNNIYPGTKPILLQQETEKPIEKKVVKEFKLSVSTLPYTGSYLIEGSQNMVFDVLSKDSSLTVLQKWNQNDYPILPLNDSLFYIKGEEDITFEFRQPQNSHTQKMLITQQGKPSWAKRIEPEKEDINTLNQYCGNFYSPEIDAHYTILINNGSLNMKIGSSTQKITSSGNKDYYYLPETGMEFNFRRNESHQIDGLILNHVRVEKLLFLKE
ncbi:beta-lactamase family protein [Pedobacter panaciterrae]|uniref:serine hydrolase domain-containing protein n=1 Tax=Pedobacter panaciterrae TaxID=363849 RepID=UPI00155DCA57|nr:serine hydrolase domain-containing protein [Pedobacter panaciterrae]NQX52401.1 beta-lactamase family protein [Pedobacter panaciterrae]